MNPKPTTNLLKVNLEVYHDSDRTLWSTEEAQEGIGHYVPERLFEYINNGSTTGSVNFPEGATSTPQRLAPFIAHSQKCTRYFGQTQQHFCQIQC